MKIEELRSRWPSLDIRVSDQVIFQDLDGETVLLDMKNGQYFGLDSIGTRIWQLLVAGTRPDDIIDTLLAEYRVSPEQCQQDVAAFLQRLALRSLIAIN